jgi:hypothetical protein
MVRKDLGLFSSSGNQQEQPFVQVNAYRSTWIKKQRVVANEYRLANNADEFPEENPTYWPARLWLKHTVRGPPRHSLRSRPTTKDE